MAAAAALFKALVEVDGSKKARLQGSGRLFTGAGDRSSGPPATLCGCMAERLGAKYEGTLKRRPGS